jgi:hypothetical protein
LIVSVFISLNIYDTKIDSAIEYHNVYFRESDVLFRYSQDEEAAREQLPASSSTMSYWLLSSIDKKFTFTDYLNIAISPVST